MSEKSFQDFIYSNMRDQESRLLYQPKDTLDVILEKLELKQLLTLALTCKVLHVAVLEFMKHKCSASNLEHAFKDFAKNCNGLLTPKESEISTKASAEGIDLSKAVEDMGHRERIHLLWLMRHRDWFEQKTYRLSLADEERVAFTHRGNSRYIPIEQDEDLGRNICNLRDVCWLHWIAKFQNVPPGVYTARAIIKVSPSCRMPHSDNQFTYWMNNRSDTTPRTGKKFWDALNQQVTPGAQLCNGLTVHVVDKKGIHEEGTWIAVEYPSFRMEEEGEVLLEMKDVECPWWKSGILFDFVELRKQ